MIKSAAKTNREKPLQAHNCTVSPWASILVFLWHSMWEWNFSFRPLNFRDEKWEAQFLLPISQYSFGISHLSSLFKVYFTVMTTINENILHRQISNYERNFNKVGKYNRKWLIIYVDLVILNYKRCCNLPNDDIGESRV